MKAKLVATLVPMAILGLFASTPLLAANLLDDMIDSVKCAGANDVEACKTKSRKDWEDYQKQKQAGGGATNGTTPEKCVSVSAVGPANIDAAYAEILDRIAFKTLEQKNDQLKRNRHVVKDDEYRHRAIPGQLYDMCDTVAFVTADGQRISVFAAAKLKILKTGETSVEARHCVSGGGIEYSDEIAEVFKSAVK